MIKSRVEVEHVNLSRPVEPSVVERVMEIQEWNIKIPSCFGFTREEEQRVKRTAIKTNFKRYLRGLREDPNRVARNDVKLLVARIRGEIVGWALSHALQKKIETQLDLPSGRYYYLDEAETHSDHVRKGVATALTRARVEHAERNGYTHAITKVESSNQAALGHVAREGFKEIGVRENAVNGFGADIVYRWFVKKL